MQSDTGAVNKHCVFSDEGPPAATVIPRKPVQIMQNICGDNHLPTGPCGPALGCNWRSSHITAHLTHSK